MPIQQMLLGTGGGSDPIYIDDVFKMLQYTGTDSYPKNIVNGIDFAGEGGAIFGKPRTGAYNWTVHDTEQGVQKGLAFNGTGAQYDNTGNQGGSTTRDLTSFNSDGVTLGTAWSASGINPADKDVITYSFRKCPGFFDVVKYNGNSETAFNVSHSLGVKPGAILIKSLGSSTKWYWWSKGMATNSNLKFNTNSEISTDSNYDIGSNLTSTTFEVPPGSEVNYSNEAYIAYLWADGDEADAQVFGENGDKPLIKTGMYDGTNGHNDINIGFEPQWLLIKRFDPNETEHWFVFDTFRGWGNSRPQAVKMLKPNANNSEFNESSTMSFTPTPTGFRFESGRSDYNAGGDYLYMAIRRPDNYVAKPETDATKLFHMVVGQSTSAKPDFLTPFEVDLALMRQPSQSDDWNLSGRLLTDSKLHPNNTNSQSLHSDFAFDFEDGWGDASWSTDRQSWNWKRGKGLDVLVYKGNGSNRAITHNLNAVPEMIWIKNRDNNSVYWVVYHVGTNTSSYLGALYLNTDDEALVSSWGSTNYWNNTLPTSTQFSVGTIANVNSNNDEHVAVLFASVNGISKVGSYTGNGTSGSSTQTISTGFAPRFLIIKNTTESNNWFVLDTTRGWGSGNDQLLTLDSNSAQVASDFGAPTSSGFTLTGDSGAFNENNKNYIYYCHA